MKMRKVKKMKIARALFFLPIALLLLPIAHAATPTTGTGTATASSMTTTSARMVDGNTILTLNFVVTFSGAIVGTVAAQDTFIIFSSGKAVEHGTGTLTGSVLGRSGTIGISFEATLTLATNQFEGQFAFLSGTGTGGLSNLEGQGTAEGQGPLTIAYSVAVIFT